MYPKSEQFPGKGEYYSALANAYGELAYVCPGLLISEKIAEGGAPSWNYRYGNFPSIFSLTKRLLIIFSARHY